MTIKVLRPGLLTTIQDLGRGGWRKYGVVVGGAMDSFALRIANMLVGNEEGEAALEITLLGPTLQLKSDCILAITGANLSPTIDGEPLPLWRPVPVHKGSIVGFGQCIKGCRAYLAISGGLRVPKVMGSYSTYLRAGLGGFQGRALQAGDLLRLGTANLASSKALNWGISDNIRPKYEATPVVRVIEGEQYHWFTQESRKRLWASEFQVSAQADRMGYRLQGRGLELSLPRELLSEAVCPGTIQVPRDGNPIVLMADCQTTGGYPKIGQVPIVDFSVLAQLKPGDKLRFQPISVTSAQKEYLERENTLQKLKQSIALRGEELV